MLLNEASLLELPGLFLGNEAQKPQREEVDEFDEGDEAAAQEEGSRTPKGHWKNAFDLH